MAVLRGLAAHAFLRASGTFPCRKRLEAAGSAFRRGGAFAFARGPRQGTGAKLFPCPGKQKPCAGAHLKKNRVRARLGESTNTVRDLPAAGALLAGLTALRAANRRLAWETPEMPRSKAQLFGRFCAWGYVWPHVLRIHESLARAFVRQISSWPQGTGVRLFPRPGKQEPGAGHTPGINRVRARLGESTNMVRELLGAAARIARRSRAGVRDAGEKKTGRTALREAVAPQAASRVTSLPVQTALRRDGACASCSPQARRCVSRRSWGCCGGVPRWGAFRRASGRGCAPWR